MQPTSLQSEGDRPSRAGQAIKLAAAVTVAGATLATAAAATPLLAMITMNHSESLVGSV